MQALRLNEVLTRVVAWHNRHPLARRITAHQVHSIGEVVLPFASALAAAPPPAPPAAPGLPAMQDLLAPAAEALVDADPPGAGLAEQAEPRPTLAVGHEHAVAGNAEQADHTRPPGESTAQGDIVPEPAPVLSMEDEAEALFNNDAPAPQALPDEDGPEVLIELSTDPEPQDATPADGMADSAPELATADADSAALAAAFAAAMEDGPAPGPGSGPVAAPDISPPAVAVTGGQPGPPADAASAVQAAEAEAAEPVAAQALQATSVEIAGLAPTQTPKPGAAPAAASLRARIVAQFQAWLRGPGGRRLPRLQATFSRDFIWPLRPGQVARWARRHGSPTPVAPADWPQRLIDSDTRLQAQARRQGLPHALPLHVLTAAIGVGDRRIRVLIGAHGQILGPRSYSPPKLATLAGLVTLGLLGTGLAWLPRGEMMGQQQVGKAAATAASAAALAASAAKLAAAAASAAENIWRAQQAESMSAGTASVDLADGQTRPVVAEAASPADAGQAAPAAQVDEALASADDSGAAPQAASTPAQQPATVPLGNVLPVLSPSDKRAARTQAQALRSGHAAAVAAQASKPAGPVFAVVTPATREKASAARGLALIRASGQRLREEAPEHRELMSQHGEWRAAWWPFESQADAERARVMLAQRGLKVEVVEF